MLCCSEAQPKKVLSHASHLTPHTRPLPSLPAARCYGDAEGAVKVRFHYCVTCSPLLDTFFLVSEAETETETLGPGLGLLVQRPRPCPRLEAAACNAAATTPPLPCLRPFVFAQSPRRAAAALARGVLRAASEQEPERLLERRHRDRRHRLRQPVHVQSARLDAQGYGGEPGF